MLRVYNVCVFLLLQAKMTTGYMAHYVWFVTLIIKQMASDILKGSGMTHNLFPS